MEQTAIKSIIETLENRGSNSNPVCVEVAINRAIDILKRLERQKVPETDFQGWPIKPISFKQLKDYINGLQDIPDDADVRVLMDDGMGYGAVNGLCNGTIYLDNSVVEKPEIQIWF